MDSCLRRNDGGDAGMTKRDASMTEGVAGMTRETRGCRRNDEGGYEGEGVRWLAAIVAA